MPGTLCLHSNNPSTLLLSNRSNKCVLLLGACVCLYCVNSAAVARAVIDVWIGYICVDQCRWSLLDT